MQVLEDIENSGGENNQIPTVLTEEIQGLYSVEGFKCSVPDCPFLTTHKCDSINHIKKNHPSQISDPLKIKLYKIKYGDNRVLQDSTPNQIVSTGFLENMQEWGQMSQSHTDNLQPRDHSYFDRNLGWTDYYKEVGYENCIKSVSVEECDLPT